MGVGSAENKEKLDFPHLLETEVANVRSLQNPIDRLTNEDNRQEVETENSADSDSSEQNITDSEKEDSTDNNLVVRPDNHCTKICGKILRIMGDEQTSKVYGRHLRSMGDEIFCRYAIRRSLEHLVQAVSNEGVSGREVPRQRPRRPSSSW